MIDEKTMFEALADREPHSAAELKKAVKGGDDFEATLEDFKARGLIAAEESGKTEKFRMTDEGWRTHRARYVKSVTSGRAE